MCRKQIWLHSAFLYGLLFPTYSRIWRTEDFRVKAESLQIFVNLWKNLRKYLKYLAWEDPTLPPGATSLAAAPSEQISTFCKFLAGIFCPRTFCQWLRSISFLFKWGTIFLPSKYSNVICHPYSQKKRQTSLVTCNRSSLRHHLSQYVHSISPPAHSSSSLDHPNSWWWQRVFLNRWTIFVNRLAVEILLFGRAYPWLGLQLPPCKQLHWM